MTVHQAAARFSVGDVKALSHASDLLATIAAQVRRSNPSWAESVVAMLIEVNNTVMRLHDKGERRFALFYAKQQAQKPQDVPLEAAAVETSNQAPASPAAAPRS